MNAHYRNGRADGLREALAIVRAMEEAEARKLERSARLPTRNARRTRWQAYRNAGSRITTTLNRVVRVRPKAPRHIEEALARVGL